MLQIVYYLLTIRTQRGSPRDIIAKGLKCDIRVCKFGQHSFDQFRSNTVRKSMTLPHIK